VNRRPRRAVRRRVPADVRAGGGGGAGGAAAGTARDGEQPAHPPRAARAPLQTPLRPLPPTPPPHGAPRSARAAAGARRGYRFEWVSAPQALGFDQLERDSAPLDVVVATRAAGGDLGRCQPLVLDLAKRACECYKVPAAPRFRPCARLQPPSLTTGRASARAGPGLPRRAAGDGGGGQGADRQARLNRRALRGPRPRRLQAGPPPAPWLLQGHRSRTVPQEQGHPAESSTLARQPAATAG
jgi:hypothetical protein